MINTPLPLDWFVDKQYERLINEQADDPPLSDEAEADNSWQQDVVRLLADVEYSTHALSECVIRVLVEACFPLLMRSLPAMAMVQLLPPVNSVLPDSLDSVVLTAVCDNDNHFELRTLAPVAVSGIRVVKAETVRCSWDHQQLILHCHRERSYDDVDWTAAPIHIQGAKSWRWLECLSQYCRTVTVTDATLQRDVVRQQPVVSLMAKNPSFLLPDRTNSPSWLRRCYEHLNYPHLQQRFWIDGLQTIDWPRFGNDIQLTFDCHDMSDDLPLLRDGDFSFDVLPVINLKQSICEPRLATSAVTRMRLQQLHREANSFIFDIAELLAIEPGVQQTHVCHSRQRGMSSEPNYQWLLPPYHQPADVFVDLTAVPVLPMTLSAEYWVAKATARPRVINRCDTKPNVTFIAKPRSELTVSRQQPIQLTSARLWSCLSAASDVVLTVEGLRCLIHAGCRDPASPLHRWVDAVTEVTLQPQRRIRCGQYYRGTQFTVHTNACYSQRFRFARVLLDVLMSCATHYDHLTVVLQLPEPEAAVELHHVVA